MFTNKDISQKFGVSREAARQWAKEFEMYLSPSATPMPGAQRNYTADDLAVFALVANMKAAGKHTPEIHAALKSGQRGNVDADSIIPRGDAGVNAIRLELALAREQWERDRAGLQQQLADERSRADQQQGKVELLQQQLADKERAIRELYRDIARLEAAQDDE